MRYGTIAGVARAVPRVVQGTTMLTLAERERGYRLLDAAFTHGVTAFETARHYGEAELVLGPWLRERGLRDAVTIIDKGATPREGVTTAERETHAHLGRDRVTPDDIATDLTESLARLGVDFIDIYLLHRDDPQVPVGPIVEALNAHHRAGRIGLFGGSNWSHERVAKANAYAAAHDLIPFTVSSPNFSLAEQLRPPWQGCLTISGPGGAAARRWYAEAGIPLLTWSSLAGGFFSGRFRRDNLDAFTATADRLAVDSYASEENFRRLGRVRELGAVRGLSAALVALAWLLNGPLDTFAVVGAHTPDEVAQNVAAAELILTPAERDWLDLRRDDRG